MREMNPIGPPYLSGASSNAKNASVTSTRTTQSDALIYAAVYIESFCVSWRFLGELSTECYAGDVREQSCTQKSNSTHNHANSGGRHFVGVPTAFLPCIGKVIHCGSQCLGSH